MKDCDLLENCAFVKKYRDTKKRAYMDFVSNYCEGAKNEFCEIKKYWDEHGESPEEDKNFIREMNVTVQKNIQGIKNENCNCKR